MTSKKETPEGGSITYLHRLDASHSPGQLILEYVRSLEGGVLSPDKKDNDKALKVYLEALHKVKDSAEDDEIKKQSEAILRQIEELTNLLRQSGVKGKGEEILELNSGALSRMAEIDQNLRGLIMAIKKPKTKLTYPFSLGYLTKDVYEMRQKILDSLSERFGKQRGGKPITKAQAEGGLEFRLPSFGGLQKIKEQLGAFMCTEAIRGGLGRDRKLEGHLFGHNEMPIRDFKWRYDTAPKFFGRTKKKIEKELEQREVSEVIPFIYKYLEFLQKLHKAAENYKNDLSGRRATVGEVLKANIGKVSPEMIKTVGADPESRENIRFFYILHRLIEELNIDFSDCLGSTLEELEFQLKLGLIDAPKGKIESEDLLILLCLLDGFCHDGRWKYELLKMAFQMLETEQEEERKQANEEKEAAVQGGKVIKMHSHGDASWKK